MARMAPLVKPSSGGWLTEMIGDENRFAVARHQRVHRAEQDRGGHG